MQLVSIGDLMEELAFTSDMEGVDLIMLQRKLDAAVAYVERLLGFAIEARFPDVPPAALQQAIYQLAVHWYENREVTGEARTMPFGINEIITEYRDYTF